MAPVELGDAAAVDGPDGQDGQNAEEMTCGPKKRRARFQSTAIRRLSHHDIVFREIVRLVR